MGKDETPRSGLMEELLEDLKAQESEPMLEDQPVASEAQEQSHAQVHVEQLQAQYVHEQQGDEQQVHPALTDFYIFCDLVAVRGANIRYSPSSNMYALALLCVRNYDEKNLGPPFTRYLEKHREIVDVWRQLATVSRSETGEPLRPGRALTAVPDDVTLSPCVVHLPNRDRYFELSHGEEHIRRWRLESCTQQFDLGRTV